MGKVCDRSPCDGLLSALGNFIFGVRGRFFVTAIVSEVPTEVTIEYCPYCGTRLEEVPALVIDKFMRPKRKRDVSAP